jgi:DNA-binding NtrC family response regulator
LNGEEALARLVAKDFEVVILDVMMPGLGGLEVLRQIKATHPNTQVILLTGHGSTREGIEGMRLGAFDYLIKPVDLEDMLEKMKAAAKMAGTG